MRRTTTPILCAADEALSLIRMKFPAILLEQLSNNDDDGIERVLYAN